MDEKIPATATILRLVINFILLTAGNCGGPMIMRLYYLNGGNRIWLSGCLQTAGWPVTLIPLVITHTRRSNATRQTLILTNWRVLLAAATIGVLMGLDNYLYAFLIVRQRLTAASINAVVLLTVGAVVLGIQAEGDKPAGESKREYVVGFMMTVGASALYGVILPMVELTYKKIKPAVTYTQALEIELVICFFGTVFSTLGMLFNHDFQVIPREAEEFEHGQTKYYLVIAFSAVIWQCVLLGTIGVIFYSSSFLGAVINAFSLPITQVLAVIFFHEKFQANKWISLFLCLWGFVSYCYGELTNRKKNNNIETPNQDDTIGGNPIVQLNDHVR